jgi:hypothetical protein
VGEAGERLASRDAVLRVERIVRDHGGSFEVAAKMPMPVVPAGAARYSMARARE